MDDRWLHPFTFKMKPTTLSYNYLLEETFSALFIYISTKCCLNILKNSLGNCLTNSTLSLKFMNENAHSLCFTTSRRVLCECWTFTRINKIELEIQMNSAWFFIRSIQVQQIKLLHTFVECFCFQRIVSNNRIRRFSWIGKLSDVEFVRNAFEISDCEFFER